MLPSVVVPMRRVARRTVVGDKRTTGEGTTVHEQVSSRRLAATLSVAYLVVAAALGGTLLVTSGQAHTDTPSPVGRVGPALPGIGTDPAPAPPAPAGFEAVDGPGDISTVVPAGWWVEQCDTNAHCMQAGNPDGGAQLLRFGGSPSEAGPIQRTQNTFVRDFKATRPGYRTIRFEETTHRGFPAVLWEFEWDSGDVRWHACAMNWRVGGHDYMIYAASDVTRWTDTSRIHETMVANSAP